MATIKTIDIKGWVDKGSPVYSMGVSIEYDWMPLTPDQQDAIKNQAEQQKGIIENLLMTWNKSAPTGEFKTANTVKPEVRTVSAIDKAVIKSDSGQVVMCSECNATCEIKTSRNGKTYAYCPNCRDNRMMSGKPFPPRGD